MTEYLQLLLRKSGHCFNTSAEREVARTIKEKVCYVALNPYKEEKDFLTTRQSEDYVLPDGKTIKVFVNKYLTLKSNYYPKMGAERFRAPEILFNPDIVGSECPGLHQMIVDSIQKADMDLRKSLFSNIVLSGGSTTFRGTLLSLHECHTKTIRFWRSIARGGAQGGYEGCQNQNICSTREKE